MAHVEQERVEFKRSVPGQFNCRINSFSALSKILKPDGAESFKLPEFESGGHKWTLSLYPNGDSQFGGGGHISLYLNIVDASDHSYGSEVSVVYKMLVWDQIRDEFPAVEDIKMRKFHSLKKQWGFTRLMSLATFKDSSNGYLVDDCCSFGIKMLVVSADVHLGCLSMVTKPANGTFKWTLDKFSTLGEDCYYSDPFTVESQQWKLGVHPNGYSTQKGLCLSFFLETDDVKCHGGSKVYVDATLTLRLCDQLSSKHQERSWDLFYISVQHGFDGSYDWGFHAILPLSDLKDKVRGVLIDDSLVLEGTINAVSKITDIQAE